MPSSAVRPVCSTDADLKRLAAEYNRGSSIRMIAGLRGWSYGFVHARLRVAEEKGYTAIRPKGSRPARVT